MEEHRLLTHFELFLFSPTLSPVTLSKVPYSLKPQPQTRWDQDKGEIFLFKPSGKPLSSLSATALEKGIYAGSNTGSPVNSALLSQNQRLPPSRPAVASPGKACWGHITLSLDRLQAPARLGPELQPPCPSWREQKLPGAGNNELPHPSPAPHPILTGPTPFPPTSGKSPRSFSHPRAFIYVCMYVCISLRGDGVRLPRFSEAKTLWQPRMKVFV